MHVSPAKQASREHPEGSVGTLSGGEFHTTAVSLGGGEAQLQTIQIRAGPSKIGAAILLHRSCAGLLTHIGHLFTCVGT